MLQAWSGESARTLRYAAGQCGARYPLPVRGQLRWQQGQSLNLWHTTIVLENLSPGELLLPSVALLTRSHYAVRCSLTADIDQWWLTPISTDMAVANFADCASPAGRYAPANVSRSSNEDATKSAITTHLDLFAVHQPIDQAHLRLEVVCETPPNDYLVAVSRRQQSLSVTPLEQPPASCGPEHSRTAVKVRGISQMTQPAAQRSRTCSPTSLSMLMGYHGAEYQPAFIDLCKEPSSGLYGVWPLT